MISRIDKFQLLLNQHRFFDAHELFEEIWFPIRKDNIAIKQVYRGFINSAVSLELYKRQRPTPSAKVWSNSMKMLSILDTNYFEYQKEFLSLRDFTINFKNSYISS
jgi:hypothetical protein